MSESNSKRQPVQHCGFEWAGAVARVRRSGKSPRSGRRSVLLGMLTSVYVNSSRAQGRSGSDRG